MQSIPLPTTSSPLPARPQHLLQEQLLRMGPAAPIDEVLACFDFDKLEIFARQELPVVCTELNVRTVGELAKHSREQMLGPRCRYASMRTIAYIEKLFGVFGLQMRYALERDEMDYIESYGLNAF